jgi:methionyl-tRNA formyltransferase
VATIGYIGNLMQVPEYLFHEKDLTLAGVISEAGKLNDDLLTFTTVRGIPLYEADGPEAVVAAAKKIKADYFVMCAFGIKIPDELIKTTKIFNIHPSLLPDYRGRHPTFWATIRGEKSLGITLHKVAAKIDAGEIIAQRSASYYLWMSEQDIFDQLIAKTPELVADLQLYLKGKKKGKINSGGSYDKPAREADYTISLEDDSPATIFNKVRSQKRYKGAKLVHEGRTLWIKNLRMTRAGAGGPDCIPYTKELAMRLIDYVQE